MRRSVLAIDDEPHMLRLLERLIADETAYELTATGNSLRIPEILSSRSFDLILTDLRMPGMDGMDVLRYIREQGRDELVVIITAFGSLENAAEALALGAFGYLTKPLRKEELLRTIARGMEWQECRRLVRGLEKALETEPYPAAAGWFEGMYVRRLARQTGSDYDLLARRTGLSAERIRRILEDND